MKIGLSFSFKQMQKSKIFRKNKYDKYLDDLEIQLNSVNLKKGYEEGVIYSLMDEIDLIKIVKNKDNFFQILLPAFDVNLADFETLNDFKKMITKKLIIVFENCPFEDEENRKKAYQILANWSRPQN